MKKVINYFIVLVALLLIGSTNVYADTGPMGWEEEHYNPPVGYYTPEEIDPGTYVIGKHMYSRDESGDYKGQLTTQHIMLAAKTIQGNGTSGVDNMVIYYKNPRGNWINGITGDSVQLPERFEVSFVNEGNMLDDTPILELETVQFPLNENDEVEKFAVLRPSVPFRGDCIDCVEKYEIYSSDEEFGKYEYFGTTEREYITEKTGLLNAYLEPNEEKYFRTREVVEIGNKTIYSDFSHPLYLTGDAPVGELLVDNKEIGEGPDTLDVSFAVRSSSEETYFYDFEICEFQDGQLVEDSCSPHMTREIPIGTTKTFALRYFCEAHGVNDYENTKVLYGDFSEKVTVTATAPVSLMIYGVGGSMPDGGENQFGKAFEIHNQASGDVELYSSDTQNGEYTFFTTIKEENIVDSKFSISYNDEAEIGSWFRVKDSEGNYSNSITMADGDLGLAFDGFVEVEPDELENEQEKVRFVLENYSGGNLVLYASDDENGDYSFYKTISEKAIKEYTDEDVKFFEVTYLADENLGPYYKILDISGSFSNIVKAEQTSPQ